MSEQVKVVSIKPKTGNRKAGSTDSGNTDVNNATSEIDAGKSKLDLCLDEIVEKLDASFAT